MTPSRHPLPGSTRAPRMSLLVALGCAGVATPGLHAAESVSIPLAGLQIRNAVNQARNSAPSTIDPANNYTVTYSADTRVRGRGEGGFVLYILPTILPNPVTLDQAFQTLSGDPMADFPDTSEIPNPPGTHPAILTSQLIDQTATQSGIQVTVRANLLSQIGADNVASFSITNVQMLPNTGAIRLGYLEFTQGTLTITRNPIVGPTCDDIDFNNDGIEQDPTDLEAFLSVYSGAACVPPTANCQDIDFNNDGIEQDPTDIESFLSVYSGGPCL